MRAINVEILPVCVLPLISATEEVPKMFLKGYITETKFSD